MLIVLSPAKTLDFTAPDIELQVTLPSMAKDTAKLAQAARKLSRADLMRMMDISEKLADLNVERFRSFQPNPEKAQGLPAMLAFAGDVYEGLKARTLDEGSLDWAQDHVWILSGMYGMLRPLDLLQPYRLEMGVRIKTDRGATLYDFWGDRIAKALSDALKTHDDPTLVNLASQEYFGAVDIRALKKPLVTCIFKQEKAGELRNLGMFSKTARGLMTRYAIDNRIDRAEGLKAFNRAGYSFRADLSGPTEWVFTRQQPAPGTPMAISEA